MEMLTSQCLVWVSHSSEAVSEGVSVLPVPSKIVLTHIEKYNMQPIILPLLFIPPVFSCKAASTCDLKTKEMTNLWRISADPPSYFFGTRHVPYTRVWPGISEQAKKAFQSADQVYLETVDVVDDGYDRLESKNCNLLPSNKKLTEILSPELMRRLRDYLGWLRTEMPSWSTPWQKILGLNYDALTKDWERMRPQWLR